LIAVSLRAGQRAATVMSLIRMFTNMKDILTRLPTQKNRQIEELLPHRRQPQS